MYSGFCGRVCKLRIRSKQTACTCLLRAKGELASTKRQTGHNFKINLVLYSEERCCQTRQYYCFLLSSVEMLDLYNKTCATGHTQCVDEWYTNFSLFGRRWTRVHHGKQLLHILLCKKLLVSISKFCQVLKEEMKKYVIRITAIDLPKGSKHIS